MRKDVGMVGKFRILSLSYSKVCVWRGVGGAWLGVLFRDQQHQHHPKPCWKCRLSGALDQNLSFS